MSPVLKKIGILVLAVLPSLYVGNQIYTANHVGVRTETAVYGTTWESVEASARIIRNEKVITQETSGVLRYLAENGSHVASGGIVAEVYASSADALAQQEIQALKTEIKTLEKLSSPGETYALDPNLLGEKADEKFSALVILLTERKLTAAEKSKSELLTILNRRQIASGEVENFNTRISELNARLETLQGSVSTESGSVFAPCAGYFMNTVDGYESEDDYQNVLSLTALQLQSKPSPGQISQNAVGKICTDFNWYLAFTVDAQTALRFKELSSNTTLYVTAAGEEFPVEIAAINQESLQAEAAIILRCNTMNAALASLRIEEIRVELKSCSGVMVPASAVHYASVTETVTDENGTETEVVHENVKGIYVKSANQLVFVQIFSDATINGYVICREPTEEETLYTERTVRLYDQVVTEGKDLYDGKVVE